MINGKSRVSAPPPQAVTSLGTVKLAELMALGAGRPEIVVGLIDGPVQIGHPDFAESRIRQVAGADGCAPGGSAACTHGTFVAGILSARRGSPAPAICPGCTLLVRPVFTAAAPDAELPNASAETLAEAIVQCVEAGARLLNLSLALQAGSTRAQAALLQALDHAARRGVLVVAAAGNQGAIGGSAITAHPWVIPVAASNLKGRPLSTTNLGHSIGRRGLRAPGDRITSLGLAGEPLVASGTSAATPFVTGAIALAWSQFPKAGGGEVRAAFLHAHGEARTTVTPPLLDAWAAYRRLAAAR